MNEWITNAVKYAFPDGFGAIEIELDRVGDQLRLKVTDDGIGAAVDDKGGRGSRLLQMLASSIQADLKLEVNGGTQCILTMDIT